MLAEGWTIGVDTHLHIHRLLEELPDDLPPEKLKTKLAPLLCHTPESQHDFYDFFDELLPEVEALNKKEKNVQAGKNSDANNKVLFWRRLIIALLVLLLAISGYVAWLLMQPKDPVEYNYSQTVVTENRNVRASLPDSAFQSPTEAVFIENPDADTIQHQRIDYTLDDSLRVILLPKDTVGTDSVAIDEFFSNFNGSNDLGLITVN